MDLLAGNATPKTKAQSISSTKLQVFQFTALESGTIEEIQIRSSAASGSSTSQWVAVYADTGANAPVTGAAPLGKGKHDTKPGNSEWWKVTGLSIAVLTGTKYWVAVNPQVAATSVTIREEAGLTFQNKKPATFAEPGAVEEWGTVAVSGPVDFQALGTKAAIVAVSCLGNEEEQVEDTATLVILPEALGLDEYQHEDAGTAVIATTADGSDTYVVAGVIEYGDDGVVVIYAAALGTDVHHVGEAGPLLPLFVGGGSSVVTLSGGAVQ